MTELVGYEGGAVLFLKSLLQRSTTTLMTDYVGREKWRVDLKAVEDFISLELVEEKISSVDPSGHDEKGKRALHAFRAALERRRSGAGDVPEPFEDE